MWSKAFTQVSGDFDTPEQALQGIAALVEGKDLMSVYLERKRGWGDKPTTYHLNVIYNEPAAAEEA